MQRINCISPFHEDFHCVVLFSQLYMNEKMCTKIYWFYAQHTYQHRYSGEQFLKLHNISWFRNHSWNSSFLNSNRLCAQEKSKHGKEEYPSAMHFIWASNCSDHNTKLSMNMMEKDRINYMKHNFLKIPQNVGYWMTWYSDNWTNKNI